MQEENKIDSYFWNFDEKCLFSTIRTVLSQNLILDKDIPDLQFFMSDDIKT